MRPLATISVLAVSLLVAACSSGSSSTPSPDASQPASSQAAPSPIASPAESAPAESAAASAEPSIDESVFGSDYAKIQEDLQSELAEISAGLATATTPEAFAEAYSKYADAMRESIEATRAIDWPAAIRSDVDKLLDYEEELAGLYESFAGDPGTIDQERLAAISAEMPAVVQRIAAYFGVTVTP